MHPTKSKLLIALAAALLGFSTLASAASFVRVPAVIHPNINNGGLTPAADSSDSGGSEPEDPGTTISVGSTSIDGAVGSIAMPVTIVVGADGVTTAAQGAGTLSFYAMKDGPEQVALYKPAMVDELGLSANGVAVGPGGAALDYTVTVPGASVDDSNPYYRTDVFQSAATSYKTQTTHQISVSVAAGIHAAPGTYSGTIYGSATAESYASIERPSVATTSVLATRTGTTHTADCTLAPGLPTATPARYNPLYPTLYSPIPNGFLLQCVNTTDAPAVVHLTFAKPSPTLSDSDDPADSSLPDIPLFWSASSTDYSDGVPSTSETVIVPAEKTGAYYIYLWDVMPAGQDIAAHHYAATYSISMTYDTEAAEAGDSPTLTMTYDY